jgi:lipopolysaccharide heptosyltransferase I
MVAVEPREFKKVLIVRLSALGDVIHVLPALDALRHALPRAHLAWLVEDRAATLLAGHPQVDRLHVLPRGSIAAALFCERRPLAALEKLTAFFGDLRRERFDLAIDFQSNLRSALACVASGARMRAGLARGFGKEGSFFFYHRRLRPPGRRIHKVEKYLAMVRDLGFSTAGARARIAVPEASRARVAPFFAALGAGRIVALHPGVSARGAEKRWAPEKFAAVAEALAARGARPIVTWGPGERPLAERVVILARGAATIAPETTSLLDLAAIYARCDTVSGADTGPIHLAAALGVPVVGLYGPKDPAIYAPWSSRTGGPADTIFRERMSEIGVEEVVEAVLRAAAQAPAAARA